MRTLTLIYHVPDTAGPAHVGHVADQLSATLRRSGVDGGRITWRVPWREDGTSYCVCCGEYMPMTLDGSRRVHECDRTPPLDGLPPTICACPRCGGHALSRYGCWGTPERPHEHAYMRPIHELIREQASS